MYRKMQFVPVFLLVCILFFFVVMISINYDLGEGFLAYPPPPTWPAQDGYPAPGFAPPTATPTQDTGDDLALAYTSTPWPTPTSYAVTPALTPRQGVAGGQQYYIDRYKFGSWGWHWGYWLPIPYPGVAEHIPMLVWRPWDTVDDRLITITTTPAISDTPPVYAYVTRTPVPTPDTAYIAFVATQTPMITGSSLTNVNIMTNVGLHRKLPQDSMLTNSFPILKTILTPRPLPLDLIILMQNSLSAVSMLTYAVLIG